MVDKLEIYIEKELGSNPSNRIQETWVARVDGVSNIWGTGPTPANALMSLMSRMDGVIITVVKDGTVKQTRTSLMHLTVDDLI